MNKIYIIQIQSGARRVTYARQLNETEHKILMDTLQAIIRAGFIDSFNIKEVPPNESI